jgi:hypothetical protein
MRGESVGERPETRTPLGNERNNDGNFSLHFSETGGDHERENRRR